MDYQKYGLNLKKGQSEIQRVAKNGCSVSVRLSHANLSGEHTILLTRRQIQRIAKLLQSGMGGMVLEMSPKQVRHNMQKEGGFLPMLAGLASAALPMWVKTVLPALGVGALSGFGSAAIKRPLDLDYFSRRVGKYAA